MWIEECANRSALLFEQENQQHSLTDTHANNNWQIGE
jgi:hypothetical protein